MFGLAGQPGAGVDELRHALPGHVAYRPRDEGPVGLGDRGKFRKGAQHGFEGVPVSLIVVLAAQQVGVHPGDVRLVGAGQDRLPGRDQRGAQLG